MMQIPTDLVRQYPASTVGRLTRCTREVPVQPVQKAPDGDCLYFYRATHIGARTAPGARITNLLEKSFVLQGEVD